jgi:hypothetical protein
VTRNLPSTGSRWEFSPSTQAWGLLDEQGQRCGGFTAELTEAPDWQVAEAIIRRFGSCPAIPFDCLDWQSRPVWQTCTGLAPAGITITRRGDSLIIDPDLMVPIMLPVEL